MSNQIIMMMNKQSIDESVANLALKYTHIY